MPEPTTESTPLPPSNKKRKSGKKAVATRWVWTNEMVGHLLRCLCDIKSQYEYKGLDFQADHVRVYKEAREMMAGIYDDNSFGPIAEREIPDDIPTEDRAKIMTLLADDKKAIKQ